MENPFESILRRGNEIASERREIELAADNAVYYLSQQFPSLSQEKHKQTLLADITDMLASASPDLPTKLVCSAIVDRVRAYVQRAKLEDPEIVVRAFAKAFDDNLHGEE